MPRAIKKRDQENYHSRRAKWSRKNDVRPFLLAEIDDCVRKGESFAFETTLAGLAYVGRIHQWRAAGYHVTLFFLHLPDAETAVARVVERVRQGGHHIDADVIRRRFAAGRLNLEHAYKSAVDSWAEFDNVGEEPMLLQWKENS